MLLLFVERKKMSLPTDEKDLKNVLEQMVSVIERIAASEGLGKEAQGRIVKKSLAGMANAIEDESATQRGTGTAAQKRPRELCTDLTSESSTNGDEEEDEEETEDEDTDEEDSEESDEGIEDEEDN